MEILNLMFSFFDSPMWLIVLVGLAIGWLIGTFKEKIM